MCRGEGQKGSSLRRKGNDSNYGDSSLQLDNRKFSTKDLNKITNGFRNKIGQGGFGSVYAGKLGNGIPVAVKMLDKSSLQGIGDFMAEARTLIQVHHKNLVSLIGYCKDKKSLALVFEFMSCGTLQGRLRGRESNDKPLTWLQRVRIALESAQGLEYLHTLCQPRLIHRDVKTANILLSENLEAKIADFGLSKAFGADKTHVSTRVVGTTGYLDPEYYTSNMLTEKSDVFSFGVVLLELVTGKPPILEASETIHIVKWVEARVVGGNIDSIADPNMKSQYDVNSLRKVTDVAMSCTARSSSQRPTMTNVVVQLKESLELAITGSKIPEVDYLQGDASYNNSNNVPDIEERLSPNAAGSGPGAR